MTTVTHPMRREAASTVFSNGRRRPVIVSLAPPGDTIGLQLKGERKTYCLPVDWCYRQTVIAHLKVEPATRKKGGTP